MTRIRFGFATLAALAAAGVDAGTVPDPIFADGFEAPPTPACVAGPESGVSLGATPPGASTTLLCFEVREDLGTTRAFEAAWSSVPIPRAANLVDGELDRLAVIGPNGRHLAAQFRPIARWGAPLSDTTAPILWLGVALRPDQPANTTTTFALQRYASALGVPDDGALTVTPSGGDFVVDTGQAQVTVDPANPMLIERIAIRGGAFFFDVYQYQAGVAGHGLDVAVATAAGVPLVGASNAQPGSLVVDTFEIVERGPVRAVVHLTGHLEAAGDADRCFGDPSYYAFPYSVTLSATRGSRHLDFEWHVITACTDATGNDWQDEIVRFDAASWRLDLLGGPAGARRPALAGGGAVTLRPAGDTERYRAEQRRGGGLPWARRAELYSASQSITLELAETFANPLAGFADDAVVAAIHAPWLRYREPQALEVQGDRLAWNFVSEPTLVGEGKGLWFAGRLSLDNGNADPAVLLQTRRAQARAALERGLLPRARQADFDAAGVMPPFGAGAASGIRTAYDLYNARLHDATVRDVPCTDPARFAGGQWTCAKTFGSQLWPDTQSDVQAGYVENPTPNDNAPAHDYWGGHNAEVAEYLRGGDPKFFWEFALPQAWLQAHTAYVNQGPYGGTNRNGYAPTSGGGGDGQWHRSNFGSADYSYNMGFGLVYATRPTPALRARFAQMGVASVNRFTNQPLDDTSWIAIGRINVQYLRGLLYCAQFVPGAAGATCDQELREDLDYLAVNSISAGIPCETMLTAGSQCFFGQTFMVVALFYPFLDEVHRLYGPTLGAATRNALRRVVIDTPRVYRQYGIPNGAGGRPDVNADWPNVLECTLTGAAFDTVSNCVFLPTPEPFLFQVNKPAATHLWFRSHALDPSNGLCAEGRGIADDLFPGPDPWGPLEFYSNGGWSKAASQDAQNLAYAVGGYEVCGP
jgi:hypothetical protein